MNNKARQPIRISVEDAKKRLEEGGVTFLDVVDPGTFERLTYKIEGAVRIDPRDIGQEYNQLPSDHTILVY